MEPNPKSQPKPEAKAKDKPSRSNGAKSSPVGDLSQANSLTGKSQIPSMMAVSGNVIMQQLSAISSSVAKHNTTMMDLPKALEAQTETLKAMTSILYEMNSAAGTAEHDPCEPESEIQSTDPKDELLSAAQNIIGETITIEEESQSCDGISDAVRNILEQTSPPTDFGEKLQEVVSNSFSKIANPTSLTLADDLKNRYKVPVNCKELGVPKVNIEIWSGLPHHVKTKDAKAQHLQQHLSKALIAQAKTAEQILQLIAKTKDPALQNILQSLMDSAMSVGLGMKELNVSRKQELKSSLLPEYTGLSSSQIPVTEYLFGDNLEASLKLLKSTSKIVKTYNQQSRFHPYGRQRFLPHTSGNLNFRRQSFVRTPPTTGNHRPLQWRQNSQISRPNVQYQNRFRKPANPRQ